MHLVSERPAPSILSSNSLELGAVVSATLLVSVLVMRSAVKLVVHRTISGQAEKL